MTELEICKQSMTLEQTLTTRRAWKISTANMRAAQFPSDEIITALFREMFPEWGSCQVLIRRKNHLIVEMPIDLRPKRRGRFVDQLSEQTVATRR